MATEEMLEKFVATPGGVWLQPVTFPNPDKKFHYYMSVPKSSDVLCLRHEKDAIVTESLDTEALRIELMATAHSVGVKANSELKAFKNIEDRNVRALFVAAMAMEEAPGRNDDPLRCRQVCRQA